MENDSRSYEFTLPAEENERWTPEAAMAMVGQSITVRWPSGPAPAVVSRARVNEDGSALVVVVAAAAGGDRG